MWLFLFTLLPLTLVVDYICGTGLGSRPRGLYSYVFLVFAGVTAGALCAFAGFFFIYSGDTVLSDVPSVAVHFMLLRLFLPVAGVYGLFWLISRDSVDFKTGAFYPLMCGFYAVYLPYFAFSSPVFPSSFSLFGLPVLILSFLISFAAGARLLSRFIMAYRQGAVSGKVFLCAVSVCAVLFILDFAAPSSIFALYLTAEYFRPFLCVLYVCFSAALPVLLYILYKVFRRTPRHAGGAGCP